ncbi:LysR family transcriptional regulator [Amphritea pacifica]|uniref:LysR family transcriptional regulator n=1 Tax=Amphritea pacifica TaxID=2811233 RepID=A0ABS2W659_9GAMM|nr:LysR family transcriptional regulator [Amphritea pacifica]MBN0987196.1 LysR family transcriptional regulator [Amphritea pacifica]MBN1008938.1 LysR family transcriptional regulator [Amphritea pacifica]
MSKLEAMRSFVEVASVGSFTRAAEQLDVPRIRVTRDVQELEDWLQIRLLHRTTRRVSLTSAGEDALRICERMLNDAAELENNAHLHATELVGDIRIAAPIGLGQTQLLPLITEFSQRHPKVSFQLVLSDKNAQLVDERVDIALRYTQQPHDNLIARRLFDVKSIICGSPGYLEANGTPETIQDLKQHGCLIHLDQHLWQFPSGDEVDVTGSLRANDAVTLVNATVAGMGIARLPMDLVEPYLNNGDLIALPEAFTLPPQSVWAVYLSRSYQQPVVRAFIDYVASQWQEKP